MMSWIVRGWRALGSVRLTVTLCFLLAADLGFGYFSLRDNLALFVPMSNVGLLEWANTYGFANLRQTAWFFAMLVLLGTLAVNTFVCTTERVFQIMRHRPALAELPFRLAPHMMHYAVLIILAGYMCSYLFSNSETGYALRPGEQIKFFATDATLQFHDFAPELLEGERVQVFEGYVLRPNAQVTIRYKNQTTLRVLNFNEPIHVGDIGIYLSDFQPRKRRGGMGRSYIRLIVRHDPSAVVYRFGMLVFVLGLGLYIFERKFKG